MILKCKCLCWTEKHVFFKLFNLIFQHGGTVEEPPKIIPPEDVVPVDVDDDDDPEPPGPVGGQIPSLQQIIDTEV